jgi:hypothetical protein
MKKHIGIDKVLCTPHLSPKHSVDYNSALDCVRRFLTEQNSNLTHRTPDEQGQLMSQLASI